MKFLFFAGGSYISGMEIATLHLMKQLILEEHACHAIVSGWNDGKFPTVLANAGIPHSCIKLGRLYRSKPLWTLDSLINLPAAAKALRKLVSDFNPDGIIISGVELLLSARHVLPTNIPLILYLHDQPTNLFCSSFGKYALHRCCGIIVVSEFVSTKLRGVLTSNHPITVVPNGIGSSCPLRTLESNSKVELTVGIVGQIIPRKRHDILIEAINIINRDLNSVKVCVYGNDKTEFAIKCREKIKDMELEEHFQWFGFVHDRDEIFQKIDILVAPAVEEPFGLTAIEAGSYGVAVIAAFSGAFPETVIAGETGLLFKPDCPMELAQALLQLRDKKERERMGQNAIRHIAQNFSIEATTQKFISATESFGVRDYQ